MEFLRNYGDLICVAVVILLGIIAACYVKAPSDTAIIISGLWKKPQILIDGMTGFRLPFLEQVDRLCLKPITIRIAPYIPGIFFKLEISVKISEKMLFLATKHFLNDTPEGIEKKLEQKLCDTLNMKEMITDTNNYIDMDSLRKHVEIVVTQDIESLGLCVLSFKFDEL